MQHPNFFGRLEEVEAIGEARAREPGRCSIVSFDPISLGLLKRPGDYGADIAVAEGQWLGNPMSYGGPYLGLLACREQSTSARCPAGSSARRPTATASAAGC